MLLKKFFTINFLAKSMLLILRNENSKLVNRKQYDSGKKGMGTIGLVKKLKLKLQRLETKYLMLLI